MGKRSKRKRQEIERLKKQLKKRKNRPRPQLGEPKLTPRGEYTLYEHPQKIVEIEFPSDWQHELQDNMRSILFHPPERDDVALNCYVMPISINLEEVVDNPKMVAMCNALFKQANAVNPRRDPTIPYFCMIADRNQEGIAGDLRMVAACDIFMGISTYCPEDERHQWEPVFDRMLSTFRVPRETEGLYMKVAQRLCGKLREAAPNEDYKVTDRLEIQGNSRTLPLGNLLARIKASPGRWEELADDFFEKAVSLSPDELGLVHLADVRGEIFPFIRPDSWGEAEAGLVKSPWLANLAVTYVIRIGDAAFRYISEFDLQRWELDREELDRLAVANLCTLDTITHRLESPAFPADNMPLVFVSAGDNMEASRLLNPGLYDLFAEPLGGPFIAAIPCRDALILLPNDKEFRRRVQKIVREDYERSEYAITDRLFLVTADGVALAEW